jgi:hypothetical protein
MLPNTLLAVLVVVTIIVGDVVLDIARTNIHVIFLVILTALIVAVGR